VKPLICSGRNGKPIVMEVVGENGKIIGEYAVKNDKMSKPPYILIEEAHL